MRPDGSVVSIGAVEGMARVECGTGPRAGKALVVAVVALMAGAEVVVVVEEAAAAEEEAGAAEEVGPA